MFIMDKVIFKRFCVTTVVLAIILSVLLWFTQSIKYISIIAENDVSLKNYFSLIVYLLPDLLTRIIPICVLIASIYLFSKITLDNELVVMQALGKSPWQISWSVIVFSAVLAVATFCTNIYLVPDSFQKFRVLESKFRDNLSSSVLKTGKFNLTKNITVFVKDKDINQNLKGVFISDSRDNARNKPYVIMAELGKIRRIDNEWVIFLKNGSRLDQDDKGRIRTLNFKDLTFKPNISDESKAKRAIKAHEKSLTSLLNTQEGVDMGIRKKYRFIAEGHQRILTPFLIIINVLLSILVFVVNKPERRFRSKRIFLTLTAGLCLQWLIVNCLQFQVSFAYSTLLTYLLVIFLIVFLTIGVTFSRFHYKINILFDTCRI